jgi:ABC-2 type transport system ATP-binding protein
METEVETGPTPIIEVLHFGMVFDGKVAIDDLSFTVRRGETFGLLGSNGSGKTTTIRALLGTYAATSGTLHINGEQFAPGSSLTLGYLPEERGLYKKEPVLAVMTYFGQLKGMSKLNAETWSRGYLERVGLSEYAQTRIDKLSGGQQQKVQLGVTIMDDPELLILDEPTKGFDPVNRRLLLSLIEERKRDGATVIMVTHQMDEVERLCDRIMFLKDGRQVAAGTVAEVQSRFGARKLEVAFDGTLPSSSHFSVNTVAPGSAELTVLDDSSPGDILRELVEAGAHIDRFEITRTSLDDIFVELYGSSATAELGN